MDRDFIAVLLLLFLDEFAVELARLVFLLSLKDLWKTRFLYVINLCKKEEKYVKKVWRERKKAYLCSPN